MAALLKPTPSSPQTLNISSHHVQFHHSSPSSLIGSPGTNHNSTPNNHQITPSGSQLQIKKESGALSPVSGSENDGPPSIHQDIFSAKCKRKINFSHFGLPPRNHQPATVARRNARERNRVKQVNNGFAALKQHIPVGHRAKKMSKVETLRCAVDYIRNLQSMLDPRMTGSGTSGREDSEDSHYNRNHPLSDFDSGSYAGQSEQMSPSSSSDPSSPSFAPETSYLHSSTNQHPSTSLYDYENYDPVSPDDEELLDAISIWQQT